MQSLGVGNDRTSPNTVMAEIAGRRVVALNPGVYGGYDFRRGNQHVSGMMGVDSGHVAARPVGLVRGDAGLGTIEVGFDRSFTCRLSGCTTHFGDIKISMWWAYCRFFGKAGPVRGLRVFVPDL